MACEVAQEVSHEPAPGRADAGEMDCEDKPHLEQAPQMPPSAEAETSALSAPPSWVRPDDSWIRKDMTDDTPEGRRSHTVGFYSV